MATITASASPTANAPAANPGITSRATHPALRNAELANHASVPRVPPSPRVSVRDAKSSPRHATDDEILGLDRAPATGSADDPAATDESAEAANAARAEADPDPENLRAAFDEHPELRTAWQDAQAYRETFATPEEAREASTLLADLDHMDALFYSGRSEDHAELARAVANLDPAAFASLAQAMASHAKSNQAATTSASAPTPLSSRQSPPASLADDEGSAVPSRDANRKQIPRPQQQTRNDSDSAAEGPTQQQAEFFHSANAAAVQGVLDAIETQVARLLPESVSKSARNRVVGEIYRELDLTLRSNRQLAQQMREAYRGGSLDAEHQRALVGLVTGRAKQALPGVAKRVLGEWTSTLVTANQDRLARQRAAEGRIDIAGSGGTASGGRQSRGPRDIDYARMSDSDILNL